MADPTVSSVHPVANVGLSATAAQAVTVLIVWGISLAGAKVPDNVTSALTVLLAIAAGYLIHSNTQIAAPIKAPTP